MLAQSDNVTYSAQKIADFMGMFVLLICLLVSLWFLVTMSLPCRICVGEKVAMSTLSPELLGVLLGCAHVVYIPLLLTTCFYFCFLPLHTSQLSFQLLRPHSIESYIQLPKKSSGITYKAAHHQISRVKADIKALQDGIYVPLISTTSTAATTTTAAATSSITTPTTTTKSKPNTRKRTATKISTDEADTEDTSTPAKKTKVSTRSRNRRESTAAAKGKEVERDEDRSNADDERESAMGAANILLDMSRGIGGVMGQGATEGSTVVEMEDESGDMTELEEDAE